jgi:hypothetical protein
VNAGTQRLPPSGQYWPVDGHVHFHDVRFVAPTLDAAAHNFRAACGRSHGLVGAILLTEASGEHVFDSLQDLSMAGAWGFAPAADEPESLIAQRGDVALAIVGGRQVRAAAGLEVLALGTRSVFREGMPLTDTVEAIRRSGAVTVLPWGFGKWLGARGRVVAATLAKFEPDQLFVGDNGGRLSLLGVPALVRASERRGFRVIPGTDPFPFALDHRRVGRFGFLGEVPLPAAAPWRALRGWLIARRTSPLTYGEASGLLRLVVNQIGIQVHRRLSRRESS